MKISLISLSNLVRAPPTQGEIFAELRRGLQKENAIYWFASDDCVDENRRRAGSVASRTRNTTIQLTKNESEDSAVVA